MKKAHYFFWLGLILLNSCSLEKSEFPTGTFYGVLPCADCPGISYELQINSDSTYVEKMVYQERSGEVMSHSGKIDFSGKGILTLTGKSEEAGMRQFKFQADSLLMLDRVGKVVEGNLSQHYILRPTRPVNFSMELIQKSLIGFKARGNEPFWSLEIDFGNNMVFKPMEGESVSVPVPDPIQTPNTNVLRYQAESEKGSLQVTIFRKKCQDSMSGEEFGHEVNVWVKTGDEEAFREYAGCGDYQGNYRLNNLWILETINGKPLVERGKSPNIDFDLHENRFYGFGGCNQINGNITLDGENLTFGKIISTQMACPNLDKEQIFLDQLNDKQYSFTLEGEMLRLSNQQDTLIFKKGMEE